MKCPHIGILLRAPRAECEVCALASFVGNVYGFLRYVRITAARG
jgi:hypothetical protein